MSGLPDSSSSDRRASRRRGPARSADSTPRGPRASLKQLIPYLFEQRRLLTIALVLGLISAAASLVQPLLLGQVIGRVEAGQALGWLLVVLCAVVVVGAVLSGLQHYVLQRMGEGVVLTSRRRLIAKILHLPISQFDQRRTGDLVSRIGSDTTLLRAVLTQGFVEAISGLLVFIGALIGMLIIDPVLFGITFGVILVALVVVVLVGSRIRPAVARAQEKVGDLAAQVDRTVSSIRTIRAAGAAEREERATVRDAEEAYGLGVKVAKISAFIVPVSFLAMQLSFLVVLGLGGYRVATGAITIAQLVTFIIFLFLMIMPLGQAFGAITAVNQALGALGRIQEITSLPTETAHDAELSPLGRIVPLAQASVAGEAAIRFADVHFTYRSAAPERADARSLVRSTRGARDVPPAEIVATPVLHGVDFEVARGTRVALVGPSGAGKSTILGLIERFYDPDQGSVSLFGADLRVLDRTELRAQLGYVEQDAPVLAGTLRDNLRLGAPDASDAACARVLQAVNLGGLLGRAAGGAASSGNTSAPSEQSPAELAAALDLQVGESGIMLSGGEKQRLAIARALLSAPPVLLLDESTASLDGVNERLMRDALDSVATGRTLIVIAHRLSTVVDSDKIIVLDGGRVLGEGTHEELVASTPLYRELARHQLLVPETQE
ncbi:ABC transporter ATP-binding protein [Leucobacter chromiireducens]|uniref:ABC transporter ATP-binding protein n=1 Tax=Leucobacter chromiireducens subsp. chromiireducens TaxID=660067 RepID=A0ABS1SQG1_9MICO|nr:ABC transporter ATP-binding protein [Leucobacter chromiireducens]MBL3690417.1 ABC transporter ATP-binding protein [Leucobacter chromiireducens subsp. chromiireducens]